MEFITSHILQAKRWSIVKQGDVRYAITRNFEFLNLNICPGIYLKIS